jgi:hypothetical protein
MATKTPRWSLGDLFRLKKRPPPQPPAANPYHAVSILPGKGACPSAYRLTGLRFLSRNAPRLPLPSCDSAHCTCRFRHHKDRRAGPRRRSDQGMMSGLWNGPERRRSPGRRADDE